MTPERYQAYAQDCALNLDQTEFLGGIVAREPGTSRRSSQTPSVQELARAYATYQRVLLDHESLDFGDLLMYTLKLFRASGNFVAVSKTVSI